jgi:hypothetical protein
MFNITKDWNICGFSTNSGFETVEKFLPRQKHSKESATILLKKLAVKSPENPQLHPTVTF